MNTKTLLIDNFSQHFTSLVSWSKTHCFISCIKERSASFIISRGLFTGLGSWCTSVRMQIIWISLSSFSVLPLLTFILPQHFSLGVLANMSFFFSPSPFGTWFLLLFLKQLQPLTCSSPACHLLLLSSGTHSTA